MSYWVFLQLMKSTKLGAEDLPNSWTIWLITVTFILLIDKLPWLQKHFASLLYWLLHWHCWLQVINSRKVRIMTFLRYVVSCPTVHSWFYYCCFFILLTRNWLLTCYLGEKIYFEHDETIVLCLMSKTIDSYFSSICWS